MKIRHEPVDVAGLCLFEFSTEESHGGVGEVREEVDGLGKHGGDKLLGGDYEIPLGLVEVVSIFVMKLSYFGFSW